MKIKLQDIDELMIEFDNGEGAEGHISINLTYDGLRIDVYGKDLDEDPLAEISLDNPDFSDSPQVYLTAKQKNILKDNILISEKKQRFDHYIKYSAQIKNEIIENSSEGKLAKAYIEDFYNVSNPKEDFISGEDFIRKAWEFLEFLEDEK
jgi:hypothetical protein